MTPSHHYRAFALAFAPDAPVLSHHGCLLSWSHEALNVLSKIQELSAQAEGSPSYRKLPSGELCALLQVASDEWTSLDPAVGLGTLTKDSAAQRRPWAIVPKDSAETLWPLVHMALAKWCDLSLGTALRSAQASAYAAQALRQLIEQRTVLELVPHSVTCNPWSRSSNTGFSSYSALARLLANRLSGSEIFPELGAVVMTEQGWSQNSAELMTIPWVDEGSGAQLSLVVKLSVETLAGAQQPLVHCRFLRRIWTRSLTTGYAEAGSISGYVMPHLERPYRAYPFELTRRAADGGGNRWTTDGAYDRYAEAFGLAAHHRDMDVLHYPSDERASVVVVHKHGISGPGPHEQLKAGLALVDHGDAFNAVARLLSTMGLVPFHHFKPLKKEPAQQASVHMLKEQQLTSGSAEQSADAKVVEVQEIAAACAASVDAERQTVVIISHNLEEAEQIKRMGRTIWPERFQFLVTALPSGLHGAKNDLPLADASTAQRFACRLERWDAILQHLDLPQRSMVLMHVPLFYGMKPDDRVNKPAARKALARRGHTVQYLLPAQTIKPAEFLMRVQSALLDLVFGHAGSVWGLPSAVRASFPTNSHAPQWLCGISTLTVQKTPYARAQSVAAASRIHIASGRAEVRFSWEGSPGGTPWMAFDQGCGFLASAARQLPSQHRMRQALMETFVDQTLQQLRHLDPHALVFFNSTGGAASLPWITDQQLGPDSASAHQQPLKSAWEGLRLVRVRALAPRLALEKTYEREDPSEEPLVTWTATQSLFEVTSMACAPTFWSLDKMRTYAKRGASAYRSILLPATARRGACHEPFSPEEDMDFLHETGTDAAPYLARPYDQHLNPQAVELVVLQKHLSDSASALATAGHRLRGGVMPARVDRWVSMPSPLHILEKFKDYL